MEGKKDVEKALAASLKRLVAGMPFEKITIRQIADGAGVIRVTFYNHFQDKYDLLEWIVRREIFDPVRILISNQMYRESLVLIFSNLQRDRDFYMRAVKIEGQNSFSDILYKCAQMLLLDLFREQHGERHGGAHARPDHPWVNPENLAGYYANSMSYILLDWIRGGMAVSPEEMAMIYEYIVTRSMWDIIREG